MTHICDTRYQMDTNPKHEGQATPNKVADDTPEDSPCKKRGLTIQTVKKRVTEHEKELTTMVWLTYDHLDHGHVLKLYCLILVTKLRA